MDDFLGFLIIIFLVLMFIISAVGGVNIYNHGVYYGKYEGLQQGMEKCYGPTEIRD